MSSVVSHLRFPWHVVSAKTIIQSSSSTQSSIQLFCLFGMPGYVNSDRGSAFTASELREFLRSRNVATSRKTPYQPEGNTQCERLNSTLWKTVKLMLHTRNLQEEQWDQILHDALHAIRSLLYTAINQTPHERFLCFERRSMHGRSLPAWFLTPGPVFMKRFVATKATLSLTEWTCWVQIHILRLFVVLMGEECLPQRGTQAHVIRLQNRARVVKLFTLRTRVSSRVRVAVMLLLIVVKTSHKLLWIALRQSRFVVHLTNLTTSLQVQTNMPPDL